MAAPDQSPPLPDDADAALETLRATGLPGWAAGLSLAPETRNPQRADHGQRRTFLAHPASGTPFHVTLAPDLRSDWETQRAFASAVPTLTAQPLHFAKAGPDELLVREYIEGQSVHQMLTSEPPALSAEKATALARATLQQLEKTSVPSSIAHSQAEATEILAAFQSLPVFRSADRAFIRGVLSPHILDRVSHSSPFTRWTNGDFTPHNLIVRPDGTTRLIDYEFAKRTHFPDDVWRWDNLGSSPQAPKLSLPGQFPAWLDALFWCRQLVLSHRTTTPAIAKADTPHAVRNILSHLKTSLPSSAIDSAFSEHLATPQSPSDEIGRTEISSSRTPAWRRALRRILR